MQDQLIVSTENQKVLWLHIEPVNEYCCNFNNYGILSLRASSFPVSFMLSHPDSLLMSLINVWRGAGNSRFQQVALHIFAVSDSPLGNTVEGCMMN